jgi:hypothetical protein
VVPADLISVMGEIEGGRKPPGPGSGLGPGPRCMVEYQVMKGDLGARGILA